MIDSATSMHFHKLRSRLHGALKEDHAFSDVTSRSIPNVASKIRTAHVVAKEKGVFCGAFLVKPLFQLLDPHLRILTLKKDGANIRAGERVGTWRGKAGALFAGERLFLNLACHLSGISTLTQRYVKSLRGAHASIYDTRKTTPLWRDFEKFAVLCGGGKNHRMSLGDAVLLKDNHLSFLKNHHISPSHIVQSWKNGKRRKIKFVEMEAETIKQVWQGIKARADIILLDNMSLINIKASIKLIKASRLALDSRKPLIEVSGNIKPKKARTLAYLGVDRISVGAITHSAPIMDLSMEVV